MNAPANPSRRWVRIAIVVVAWAALALSWVMYQRHTGLGTTATALGSFPGTVAFVSPGAGPTRAAWAAPTTLDDLLDVPWMTAGDPLGGPHVD